MILFCLGAFLFSFVSEVNSFVWLIATFIFALIPIWQKKLNSYGIVLVLFFFAWYRISISQENDQQFQLPIELNQKIIEIKGVVNAIDSLDIERTFQEKRQISFLLEVDNNNFWHEASFIKVVVGENSAVGVLPGEMITVVGKFMLPFEKTVPGSFDSKEYYRENKWLGKLQVRGWDAIEKKGSCITWRKWVYLGRKVISKQFKTHFTPTNAAFLSSILIGYKPDLDNELMVEFRQWGIAHIFSISGLHLALIGFWVWFLSGFIFMSLRKRTIVTITFTFLYCLVSGMEVSTLRSLIMLVCFLSGYLVNRRTSAWNNFSAAFVLLFVWNPHYLFSAGFQLSFAAVAGILVTQKILSLQKSRSGVEVLVPDSRIKTISLKIGELVFFPMMISAATLGFTAYHFQMVSFGAVFLNIIVVPFFTLVMGVSFFYMFILFFIPIWMSYPLEKLCDLFMHLPGFLTRGAGLFTYVQMPAPWLILLLFVIFCTIPLLKLSLKKTCIIYVVYFILAQSILLYQGKPPKDRLVMINVGKASSCLVQNKSGENVLFDCGTVSGYDVISPYLRGEGINHLHSVVISHDNFDHFSCWPSIFKNFKVHEVRRNLSEVGVSGEMTHLDDYCKEADIPIANAYLGGQLNFNSSNMVGEVLHPAIDFHSTKNDESILVFLKTDWCEILFPGDAQEIYSSVVNRALPEKIKPRILVFPHHGRNIKDSETLIKWFQPDLILISGDIITADVKEVLERSKIQWLITSAKGTIEVESGLKIRSYFAGQWAEIKK